MTYTYSPQGVCSKKMNLEIVDGIITNLEIERGCNGNLQGISKLVLGRNAKEIIALLAGIRCDNRETSCPDQLAKALTEAINQTQREQE